MPDIAPVTKAVRGCARCGQDHDEVTYNVFSRPVSDVDGDFTHWGTCPATGDPILMRVLPDGEQPWPTGDICVGACQFDGDDWVWFSPTEVIDLVTSGRLGDEAKAVNVNPPYAVFRAA